MLKLMTAWRLPLIIAGAAALLAGAVALGWAIRSDIRRAAESDAAATITQKGMTDADRAQAGMLAARQCHALGRLWDIAAGACGGPRPGIARDLPDAGQPARGRD